MSRAQSGVEFILLITALLFISIPVFYLMSDYSLKSSSEVASSQLRDSAQRIVDESREMFYLGKFSKEIITLNMPDNINGMSTMMILGSPQEYYLIFNYTSSGKSINLPVSSEVPLITGNNCAFRPGCFPSKDCFICPFDSSAYKPGIKNLLIETIPSWNSMTVVNVSYVTW